MRYAIDIAPLGELSDPRTIVRLAVAAEASGWDGLSTWDTFGISMDTSAPDPFVVLAAVASATTRVRLLTSVVVLPRRRPQLVAQSVATLDRWSGGRLVLGVGSGGDPGDFLSFGETFEPKERAALMDESLALVDSFLRGETVSHAGPTWIVRDCAVGPTPIQQPRPPIWLGGMKPGALRRAARWDGWIGIAVSDDGSEMVLSPEAFGEMVDRLQGERTAAGRADAAFDIAVFGFSGPDERDLVGSFAEAGATWWLESLSPRRGSLEQLLRRIEAGPPR
jgi:alkanesulfonate monooxygenase SsuD/methylene tetrahydromethanopterin reductase-like flavin-dependent oxidoreductase (luciferase family)